MDEEAAPQRKMTLTSRRFVTSLINSISPTHLDAHHPSQQPSSGSTLNEAKNIFLTLHVLFPNELLAALDLLDRGLVFQVYVPAHSTASSAVVGQPPQTAVQDAVELSSQPPYNQEASVRYGSTSGPSRGADSASTAEREDRHRHDQQGGRPPPANIPEHRHTDSHGKGPFYVRSAAVASSRTRHDGPQHRRHPSRPSSADTHDRATAATCYEVRLDAWSCSCPAFAFAAFPAWIGGATTDRNRTHAEKNVDDGNDESKHQDDRKDRARRSSDLLEHKGWMFGGLTRGSDLAVCKHLLACVLAEHGNAFAHLVRHEAVTMEEMAGWAAGWADGF